MIFTIFSLTAPKARFFIPDALYEVYCFQPWRLHNHTSHFADTSRNTSVYLSCSLSLVASYVQPWHGRDHISQLQTPPETYQFMNKIPLWSLLISSFGVSRTIFHMLSDLPETYQFIILYGVNLSSLGAFRMTCHILHTSQETYQFINRIPLQVYSNSLTTN